MGISLRSLWVVGNNDASFFLNLGWIGPQSLVGSGYLIVSKRDCSNVTEVGFVLVVCDELARCYLPSRRGEGYNQKQKNIVVNGFILNQGLSKLSTREGENQRG